MPFSVLPPHGAALRSILFAFLTDAAFRAVEALSLESRMRPESFRAPRQKAPPFQPN